MLEFIKTYLYPFSVTLSLSFFYLAANYGLLNKKRNRLRKAKKREVYDPIHSDTPGEVDDKEILRLGIDSIRSRFLFLQKLLPITMLFLWMILLAIPYLSTLPAIYISLVVAIVSVVAGIALRPFLENIIAGVIISFFQPFRVGDTVRIDEQYGVVERIDLTQCVLRVWDWERFVIPNSKMLSKELQNLTMHDSLIWAHISFFVEPTCDLDKVEEMAVEAARNSKYSLKDEEPVFWVVKMDKDAIECWTAAWADNPTDAWELRCEMRKGIQKALVREGIQFQNIQANLKGAFA